MSLDPSSEYAEGSRDRDTAASSYRSHFGQGANLICEPNEGGLRTTLTSQKELHSALDFWGDEIA